MDRGTNPDHALYPVLLDSLAVSFAQTTGLGPSEERVRTARSVRGPRPKRLRSGRTGTRTSPSCCLTRQHERDNHLELLGYHAILACIQ